MDVETKPTEARVEVEAPAEVEEQPEENDNESERDYSVERIVKKRVRGDRVQYLLKWVGYSDAENTWEDEENLVGCQKLLQEFHEQEKREGGQKRKAQDDATSSRKREKGDDVGFDFGDTVEEIIGACMIEGKLNLYVQWKDKGCTFVSSSICNKKIPQQVIEFYESRMKFEKPITLPSTN
eukprot:TRINITY_DN13377_c0_g1_i1.p1 TRINITY_DN13377_c0_g1~~TRINITY_DN13377_c0_g1_i1.p1  ORF type:complete len:181 (-),score=51.39 TRINITY_DN13377_c0_g1_i1:57-599(-)